MKKWDYADESTFVFYIALIIGVGFVLYVHNLVISLLTGIIITPLYFSIYTYICCNRRKRMKIVKYCDYKTYGKVIGIEHREETSFDSNVTHTRHFVVEYKDESNVWHRFTTPAVNMHLGNYTLIDDLMCDVYIKGDEVLARNFREDTIFSKATLEEIENRKNRKNLIKKYRIRGCLWIMAMLLWIFLWIVLARFIPSGEVLGVVILIGILVFSVLYSYCQTEIRRITTGHYTKRTK